MKNPLILFCILSMLTLATVGQDSVRIRQNAPDSTRQYRDTTGFRNDTARRARGFSDLFSDSAKLNTSDYQLAIERSYVALDNIDSKSELGLGVKLIVEHQTDNDSVLAVLKDNVLNNAGALNLRNLQVFRTLLLNIQRESREHRELLDSTENRLNGLRNNLLKLRADSVLRMVQRDSALRQQFSQQLKEMRVNWRSSTKHLRESIATINLLQTKNSSHAITASQLLEKVNTLLDTSASRIFGKEYNYLWERDTSHLDASERSSFSKAYDGEKKAIRYYFKDSGNKRLFLLLIGFLFFFWMYRNIRKLKKLNSLQVLKDLDFSYLPSGYIVSAFIIMFSIAPLFDLHAPSAYIESMQFLLLIILSIICWKKWPRKLFWNWMVMVVLYILFSLMHHAVDPGLGIRLWLILLNVLSVVFGWMFLLRMKDNLQLKGFLRFVIILHNVMNVLSILFNIWGRFSLAQILGTAAIFSFTQAIGLAVFSKIAMEAILLQIITSRVKRGVSSQFEHEHVLNGFRKPLLFLVVVLWAIVFTTNLNIYTSVLSGLTEFLNHSRSIGNASFTIGGVLLFFMIIWIAHLLQKYVGYFFGDTGGDDEVHNKSQRSRLLIARLVLLCLGYLLAVAASGVPVDKITIVLGALGVGIGLGLQNIVNNFVSGIILIFDRPLQIGDSVEVGDKTGRVREIGLRSSTLMTADGAEVIIPNGDILGQQIVNYTLSNNQIRLEMELSVSGSKDMEVVSSAIKDAIHSSKFIFENREPQILFTKVNDNGYDVKAYFWCADVFKSEETKSDVLILLHQQLEQKGLSID